MVVTLGFALVALVQAACWLPLICLVLAEGRRA